VKRIFRYLKGMIDVGLSYTGKKDSITLYTDASLADNSDGTSTEGYLVMLYGDPVSWRSRKQNFVALSTHEAEFLAMTHGCMDAVGCCKILKFIIGKNFFPFSIYCDNKAAVDNVHQGSMASLRHSLAKNAGYLIKAYNEKFIEVSWISTTQQPADIFTKPLQKDLHDRFSEFIFNT